MINGYFEKIKQLDEKLKKMEEPIKTERTQLEDSIKEDIENVFSERLKNQNKIAVDLHPPQRQGIWIIITRPHTYDGIDVKLLEDIRKELNVPKMIIKSIDSTTIELTLSE